MPEQTTQDSGARRFRLRSAGVLALAGAVLVVVTNLLQQRSEIPRGDPLGVLEHITGTWWFVGALAGVLGILCWAVAFTTAGRALTDPTSNAFARMAEPVLLVAATVFTVTYAHDGFSSGVIAQQWASGEREAATALVDARVVEGLVGGTSVLSQALLGLALALYAGAMLRSGQYSRVLSWVGVVGALGWFLGGSAMFLRLPGASFELVLPFMGLTTAWTLGVGTALLRRGRVGPRADVAT